MGTRELVILLLGLAVIVVMLRGLFVALAARRGQLRLAIDKNIPRDVDLNALEMAELPNGGARVVARSLHQVNLQNTLSNATDSRKKDALDMGGKAAKAGHIPLLMDAVELREEHRDELITEPPIPSTGHYGDEDDDVEFDTDFDDPFEDPEDEDDDLDEDELNDEFDDDLDAEEDADKGDEDADEGDEDAGIEVIDDLDDLSPDDDELEEEFEDENDFDDVDDDEDDFLDGIDTEDDDNQSFGSDDDGRSEPKLGAGSGLDDEFGGFSMSAGERIGARPATPAAKVRQVELFDQDDALMAPKRPSLLDRFGSKQNKPEVAVVSAAKGPVNVVTTDAKPKPFAKVSSNIQSKPRAEKIITPEPNAIKAEFRETRKSRDSRDVREQAPETRISEPSEVLVINVMSREGEMIHGDDLLQVLITTGLKFGDMNIFHHRMNNMVNGPVIFSVANILNPGTFDLNMMAEFTTRGVSLFLAMPTAISNREAFELLLKTAQQIRGALDAELRDDQRNLMTGQTIEHYRQRIHDFELRRLKAAQG